MKNGKYYSLRPWHFTNGASFSREDFREFQYRAQRWQNSTWIYFLFMLPPVWIILVFSVLIPRALKMKQAANRLGILNETKEALDRMESGKTAYIPSQAQLDEWKELELNEAEQHTGAEKQAGKKPSGRKKKFLMGFGILLLFICAILLIGGAAGKLEVDGGGSVLPPLIAGTLVFGGGGAWMLVSSLNMKPGDVKTETSTYCARCGALIETSARFCPNCGEKRM